MSQDHLAWLAAFVCIALPFSFFLMAVFKTQRRAYACPSCNRDVPPTAHNCPACGAPMPDQNQMI